MLFNKINKYVLDDIGCGSYNIDEYIKIVKLSDSAVDIYIDNIHVYGQVAYLAVESTYYYKIPRAATKKINIWAKNKVKKQRMKEKYVKLDKKTKKKKIEQHFKDLYK